MKIVKPKDNLLTYLLSYLTNIGRKRLLVTRRISFFSFLEFLFIMPNKDIMSFNFYQTYTTKLLMMKTKNNNQVIRTITNDHSSHARMAFTSSNLLLGHDF